MADIPVPTLPDGVSGPNSRIMVVQADDSLELVPGDIAVTGDYVPVGGGTFTGAITVPDATADGQALAYDQAGARVVDVQVYAVGQAVDNRTWRSNNKSANLYIQALDSGGSVKAGAASLYLNGNDGRVQFPNATSVTVPAATAASHAAQVSAIDATTGRLAIGGMEVGDTGWRNVSGDILNGFALNGADAALSLRRNGDTVKLVGVYINTTGATANTLYAFGTGFRPNLDIYKYVGWPTFNATNYAAGDAVRLGGSGVSTIQTTERGAAFAVFTAEFETHDPWPTSLPGTAA